MDLWHRGEFTTDLFTPIQPEQSERVMGDAMVMGRHIISLERHNIDALKVVEHPYLEFAGLKDDQTYSCPS